MHYPSKLNHSKSYSFFSSTAHQCMLLCHHRSSRNDFNHFFANNCAGLHHFLCCVCTLAQDKRREWRHFVCCHCKRPFSSFYVSREQQCKQNGTSCFFLNESCRLGNADKHKTSEHIFCSQNDLSKKSVLPSPGSTPSFVNAHISLP